ncbi:MarR family transcriptional regulator [Paucilactobacillus hokkaidonensis JCM 18461]|uniref:MarR family transcriptional regulator n=2 Tax=Paucilactobacillus hokkaidonensis TaxID=1193095 RepID=A0A0A1H0V1_9LACO|nr:MarR family transcriptional regulator [Paucilactobacillus hokkaidonensis]KRO10020.1 transcriptional regulator yybA [Paucilactobacillus hokkaidonensis]BAP86336.1 MarR family transcriptional regulator [Paucilactobacillus hokkaidonensis JCM 18461]
MADILRTLGTVARALDSIANIEFRDIDLARGQYLYLTRICESPGIIQEQLVNQLNVDRATVTRAVHKLDKNGFINWQTDSINSRVKHLVPTDRGQTVYQVIKRENIYSTKTAVKGMSPAEVAELKRLLELMATNISRDWQQVKSGQKRKY